MLHDAQRQGTLSTRLEHSFAEQVSTAPSTLAEPPQVTPDPEEPGVITEETTEPSAPEAPSSSSNSMTTGFFHSFLEALNALAIPLPDAYLPGGSPQGGDASNDDTP